MAMEASGRIPYAGIAGGADSVGSAPRLDRDRRGLAALGWTRPVAECLGGCLPD